MSASNFDFTFPDFSEKVQIELSQFEIDTENDAQWPDLRVKPWLDENIPDEAWIYNGTVDGKGEFAFQPQFNKEMANFVLKFG